MTSEFFLSWLHGVNNRMAAQDRKIILFIDNCSAHPDVQLSNVKVVFLPPNTTSKLQPCDAGIIQAVKTNYRKSLLRRLMHMMAEDPTANGAQLAAKITLFDACLWWARAWDLLDPQTIVKCFRRCGFGFGAQEDTTETLCASGVDDTDYAAVLGDVTLAEYVACDDDIQTRHEDVVPVTSSETDTAACTAVKHPDECDTAEAEDKEDPQPIVSKTASLHYLRQLEIFCIQQNLPDMRGIIHKLQTDVLAKTTLTAKQTTMKDFFKQR